jgi:hypothetical protein
VTLALREPTGHTLNSLGQMLRERGNEFEGRDVGLGNLVPRLSGSDPHFIVQGQEVRATEGSILAVGEFLQVPTPALKRWKKQVGLPFVQQIFEGLLQVNPQSAAHVVFKPGEEGSIRAVREAGAAGFDPIRAIEVAKRVVGTGDAVITDLVDTQGEFAFDLAVPHDHDRGVGGDPRSDIAEIGDLTTGGLRIGMDLARNLSPTVQPYMYRLWCTNGASARDEQLALDARGKGMDEVWEDFYLTADRAFKRTERQIEHFYGLRQERVDNPERVIRAIGRERGLAPRTVNHLLDLVPTDALPENPTTFDVINAMTNLANDQALIRNRGGRHALENAGGAVIAESEHRCRSCQTILVG